MQTGVDFLRKVNLDHSIRLNGETVVVGGGNVAIDVAGTALRAGSSKVTMLCLEGPDEMPASPDEVEEAKEEQKSTFGQRLSQFMGFIDRIVTES